MNLKASIDDLEEEFWKEGTLLILGLGEFWKEGVWGTLLGLCWKTMKEVIFLGKKK